MSSNMTDPWAYQSQMYQRSMHYSPTMGDLDLDPPRTRIAVACNRCRRRKIKCSGAPEGGSCEGCIRANDTECVFADRPSRPSPSEMSPTASGMMAAQMMSAHLTPRSASFSAQAQQQQQQYMRQMGVVPPLRSSISTVDSRSSSFSNSPPRAAQIGSISAMGGRNGSFPTINSPTMVGKRQGSLPSNAHPYQRPPSVNSMRNRSMGDVAVARYSQSLIQAQAQQQRAQLSRLSVTAPMPTSNPIGYGPMSVPATQTQFNLGTGTMSSRSSPSSPHGVGAVSSMPAFRRPDYSAYGPMTGGSNASSNQDFDAHGFSRADVISPECAATSSPVFATSMYSASTPDLTSSESLGVGLIPSLRKNSSATSLPANLTPTGMTGVGVGGSSWYDYANLGQQTGQQQSLAPPLKTPNFMDPSQWTPGVEKMKQFLDFGDGISPAPLTSGGGVTTGSTSTGGGAAATASSGHSTTTGVDQMPHLNSRIK